jgi:hypothetical protein
MCTNIRPCGRDSRTLASRARRAPGAVYPSERVHGALSPAVSRYRTAEKTFQIKPGAERKAGPSRPRCLLAVLRRSGCPCFQHPAPPSSWLCGALSGLIGLRG